MIKNRSLVINTLVLAAIALLAVIYFTPIWWVSLTAPNYPEEAFPDGIRINFHMNGVFNGCKKIEKLEITEDVAIDCVHEMDTINHYVGMYPIAAGGVIERAFSPFLVSMLGVMLLGFIFTNPVIRTAVLAAGFVVIVGWMALTYYGDDGLKYQNEGYIEALITSLDQDTEAEKKEMTAAEALIARLKASLEESEKKQQPTAEIAGEAAAESQKMNNIRSLHVTFEKDQERKPPELREQWNGSGAQMLAWHYEKNLARYFNVPEEIHPMVAKMSTAATIVFWLMIAAMVFLLVATRKTNGRLYWLLIIPSILLPVFFIIDYSAWLWWYGHTLNDMGAFTVKPFMPTVFGDGKVAQFTTHSYPYTGFGLMLAFSVMLIIAANQRYKQLNLDK
ncbi:MAG: hypothetical protein LJE83_10865 [Gammaproteobacteria bacterium]|nr:hypothetical protein [Gammaproteobacteria bacterium]